MSMAYYQPWKYITGVMFTHSNLGVVEDYVGPGPDSMRVKGSIRFAAVGINSTGVVEQVGQACKVPIGVITETFDRAHVGTQLCVEGIVPMKVAEAVKAGKHVCWSDKNNILGLRPINTVPDCMPIGISLMAGEKDDVIPVLLKLGGANS